MSVHGYDIMEVILKRDLEIPLTEDENRWLIGIDEDIREMASKFMDDFAYLDEIKKVVAHIIDNLDCFSLEEHEIIRKKCEDRIIKLENLTTRHFTNNVLVK